MAIKPIKYIKSVLKEVLADNDKTQNSVPHLLLRKALKASADYAETHMTDAMLFFDHQGIWDYTVNRIKAQQMSGLLLEFGVFRGTSINYFSGKLTSQHFFGFDSFEGLKEDWKGWSLQKSAFNLNGQMPAVNTNVTLIKGWFDQTLPDFLEKHAEDQIQFLHIDCDTYEATVTVFKSLQEKIKPGTLILFDEYFGYRGWEIGEYLAFKEFVESKNFKYKYLAFANCQVLVELI